MATFKHWQTQDGSEAGYEFWCPGCNGPHGIRSKSPIPGATWDVTGSGDTLTISPSIKVTYHAAQDERVCHSYVENGRIRFLSDCWHPLAGQTVDLPPWPWE